MIEDGTEINTVRFAPPSPWFGESEFFRSKYLRRNPNTQTLTVLTRLLQSSVGYCGSPGITGLRAGSREPVRGLARSGRR
jgi:hypothetical protein